MSSQPKSPRGSGVNPVVRRALQATISAREYRALHDYLSKRAPRSLTTNVPSPTRFEAIVGSKDRYNEAAVRASLRVFLGSALGLKLVDAVLARLQRGLRQDKPRTSFIRSPNFRLAFSLSLMLFLHRILHRFFVRLRANLRTDDARPFRERNPTVAKALTSRFAPAIGASVAGFALGISPNSRVRITLAIYTATKSLEFLYNALDERGWLQKKPWWFGSWLLMPVSVAQLFHAFLYDRETIPGWIGSAIVRLSPSYIPDRPEEFPTDLHWPDKLEIVDSLSTIGDLKWPAFISPILHPSNPSPLPKVLKSISPITSPAHPSIASLSCALLHPSTPSCSKAYLHHLLLSVPKLARVLTIVTLALSTLKYKRFLAQPMASTNAASKRILALTGILSTSIGSLWGSICLLNSLLPRNVLPTKRFYISGAIGGLPFAFLPNSRGHFTYLFRAALYSAWTTGIKRGLWGGSTKAFDLSVFVVSWALLGALLEASPSAVDSKALRSGVAWLRGDGLVDPIEVAAKRKAKKAAGAASTGATEPNN